MSQSQPPPVPNGAETMPPGGGRKTSGLAIGALALGLLGVVPLLGVWLGLAGVILGIVALAKGVRGKGLAIAGIVTGVVLPAVVTLAVVIGAILLLTGQRQSSTRQVSITRLEQQGQKLWIICTACGHVEQTRVPLDQTFPMKCPDCGQVKAEEGFRCTTCRKVSVMPTDLRFRCPHCGAHYDYSLPDEPREP